MELQELEIGQGESQEVILFLALLHHLEVVEEVDGLEVEMLQDYLEDLVVDLMFRVEQEILHQYLHHKVIQEVHLEVGEGDLVLQVGQMVEMELDLPLHLILMEHLDQHLEDILPVVVLVVDQLPVVPVVEEHQVLTHFQHQQHRQELDL